MNKRIEKTKLKHKWKEAKKYNQTVTKNNPVVAFIKKDKELSIRQANWFEKVTLKVESFVEEKTGINIEKIIDGFDSFVEKHLNLK